MRPKLEHGEASDVGENAKADAEDVPEVPVPCPRSGGTAEEMIESREREHDAVADSKKGGQAPVPEGNLELLEPAVVVLE